MPRLPVVVVLLLLALRPAHASLCSSFSSCLSCTAPEARAKSACLWSTANNSCVQPTPTASIASCLISSPAACATCSSNRNSTVCIATCGCGYCSSSNLCLAANSSNLPCSTSCASSDWQGSDCKTPCAPGCGAHGRCRTSKGESKCECDHGWTSAFCNETSCAQLTVCATCTSDPLCDWCEEKSECQSAASLSCKDDSMGRNCSGTLSPFATSYYKDSCTSRNKSQCLSGLECSCAYCIERERCQHTNAHCDKPVHPCNPDTVLGFTRSQLIGLVIGMVCSALLLLFGVIILIMWYRKRRERNYVRLSTGEDDESDDDDGHAMEPYTR